MNMRFFNRWFEWMQRRGSYRLLQLRPDGRLGQLPKENYIERYYLLRTPIGNLNLHIFHMSDPEYLHNHPWWSGGIILKGYYIESSLDGRKTYRPRFYIRWYRPTEEFHRVTIPRGVKVWTLFWHGRRITDWGWLEDGVFVRSPDNDWDNKHPTRGIIFPRSG